MVVALLILGILALNSIVSVNVLAIFCIVYAVLTLVKIVCDNISKTLENEKKKRQEYFHSLFNDKKE